jgi:hypothetical protein
MMKAAESLPLVRIGAAPDGSPAYLVDLPPEALPPVLGRDLEAAWDAAHRAARSARWGVARGFRFRRHDGSYIDLALSDRDAACWASAVDGMIGMHTSYGLSLCLRLLALVDLLSRAHWAAALFQAGRVRRELHPSLLRTAASAPLTAEARFDEAGFCARLGQFSLDRPPFLERLTGAIA